MSDARGRRERVVSSAQWAAWADALGFITELVDTAGVRRRIGKDRVHRPVPWKRQVGGRFGNVTVELPAGCYSDDTQLRLATSRAIRSDGAFDVEAFAKIELPAFLAYALGAGKGTRAAATSLVRPDAAWSTNIFSGTEGSYVELGGNGAAMRIQPHVWAARNPSDWEEFVPDVIRNAICTHGHLRGVLGAVVHAIIVAEALHGEIPGRDAIRDAVGWLPSVTRLVREDPALQTLWLPLWERASKRRFADALADVVSECTSDLDALASHPSGADEALYRADVEALNGADPVQRGSGTKTALLAAMLADRFRDEPELGLITAANALGTDTDSIGTMAGAIFGAATGSTPPTLSLDSDYISQEADRLSAVANGSAQEGYLYPDLLGWIVPRAQIDLVGKCGQDLCLAGFGPLSPVGNEIAAAGKQPSIWQWMEVKSTTQHILVKRRPKPATMKPYLIPPAKRAEASPPAALGRQDALFVRRDPPKREEVRSAQPDREMVTDSPSVVETFRPQGTVSAILNDLRRSGLDPRRIGSAFLALARRDDGYELVIGLAGALANEVRRQSGAPDQSASSAESPAIHRWEGGQDTQGEPPPNGS